MSRSRGARAFGAIAAASWLAVSTRSIEAAPERGTVQQTDTLGMNVVTYNFDSGKTSTVSNGATLSEFVGLHYFFAPAWRIGANLQFAETLTSLPSGESHFSTFGLLPQVGWHFWDPLFAALIFGVLPRTNGVANLDLGVLGVIGASGTVADGISLSAALEVPYYFNVHRTLGLTPLAGVSIRL